MNQLKEAEKNATKLVQDARKARFDRMKEAKVEADQAIAAYRAEMEANYQASLSKQSGSSGLAGNTLETETMRDIQRLNMEFESKKSKVADMLVGLVVKVDIKPPASKKM